MMLLVALLLFQSPAAPPRDASPATGSVTACCVLRGRVVDALTDRPVRNATVSVVIQRTHEQRLTSTDDQGKWEITGLPEGEYFPYVRKAGYVQGARLRVGANVLSAPDPERTVEIRLTPGAVLSGRVVDKAGEPVDNLHVMALRGAPGPGGAGFERTGGEKTNDRGEFRLYGLPAGEFVIVTTRMSGPVGDRQGEAQVPERPIPGQRRLTRPNV